MFLYPRIQLLLCYLTGSPPRRQLIKVQVALVVEFIWQALASGTSFPKDFDLQSMLSFCNIWLEIMAVSYCLSNDSCIHIRLGAQRYSPQHLLQSSLRYNLMNVNERGLGKSRGAYNLDCSHTSNLDLHYSILPRIAYYRQ
jgi:hypothetical protein